MSHLNGQKVFGKVMRVTLSKHQTVALPREGLDDQLLTKGKLTPSSPSPPLLESQSSPWNEVATHIYSRKMIIMCINEQYIQLLAT